MHLIGFSHHYTKMHGQTHGILLSAERYFVDRFLTLEWLDYDTEYMENDVVKHYPLDTGHYLQLVFLGNNQIPFTTYRAIPKEYEPKLFSRSYVLGCPYSDLIGEEFAFKFKGEKLPQHLDPIYLGLKNYVRIFN